jgi:hypothetical protein
MHPISFLSWVDRLGWVRAGLGLSDCDGMGGEGEAKWREKFFQGVAEGSGVAIMKGRR